MTKLIIGFVGQAGCGKGTAADILRNEYSAGYHRFSAILNTILDALSIEKTRENQIKCSEITRKAFGEDVLSYAITKSAFADTHDIVVIDGIRRLEDIIALEPVPNFKLVAIDAPARTRYERMIMRGEKALESKMTWEQFQKEEQRSTEITVPQVMKRAWKTLSNADTRETFAKQIHEMMKELL